MKGGVKIRPPNYIKFTRIVQVTIEADDTQTKAFYDFLKAQLDKPYDIKAIFAFAVHRNWRNDKKWFCSELQARALEVARVIPVLYVDCNKLAPVPLILALSALRITTITELRK